MRHFCRYCSYAFHSPVALIGHLDREHASWIEDIMQTHGFVVPAAYPIPEYKAALVRLFNLGQSGSDNHFAPLTFGKQRHPKSRVSK